MTMEAASQPAAANSASDVSVTRIHPDAVPGLTGLRFLAAFSVLIAHGFAVIMHGHDAPGGIAYWVTQASGFGMTLFFVLSGFVIHYNYATLVTEGRLRGIAAYLWARFARLYPLFLLTLLGCILISAGITSFGPDVPSNSTACCRRCLIFLFSVQSWLYRPVGDTTLIYAVGGSSSVTWSISTEWFFYFLYPLVAWLILRSRAPHLTIVLVLAWCALWIALATSLYDRAVDINTWAVARYGPIAEMHEPQDVFAAENSYVRWLLYFSPYLRMGEFVLGSLVAQLYVQLRGREPGALENTIGTLVLLAAAASAIPITYLMYAPDVGANVFRKMYMNFGLAPSAALLVFCVARYDNVFSRLLTSRPALILEMPVTQSTSRTFWY